MKSILALAGKDLRLLLRDRAGLFFVFFFPLLYAIFFGTIFSGEGDGMSGMKIAVVDEDGTGASARFVGKLEKAAELSATLMDREEALDQVRKGRQMAYVVVPAGFEHSRGGLFQGRPIRLEVGLDPSRQAESGMLRGVLTQYAFESLQEVFKDRAAMRRQVKNTLAAVADNKDMSPLTRAALNRFMGALDKFLVDLPANEKEGETAGSTGKKPAAGKKPAGALPGWTPVDIAFTSVARERTGPRSAYDITMPQAFVWMFLGCSAAFAISLVTERTRGTLLRLRSAPIGLARILAGKALACFTTTICALIILFVFFHSVFGVRPDSYSLLALAFVSSSIAFVGIMMLISVMGRTEASVGGFGWAFLIVMAMLGGGMLPLAFMPAWMQTASDFSFVKWAVLAVEGAVWRGFSLSEMLLPCGILVGIGAATFAVGVRVFRVTAD